MVRFTGTLLIGLIATACSLGAMGGGGSNQPPVPPEYAALPDTVACIVDRLAPQGLRELPAKVRAGTIVLLSEGQIRPLTDVHPVDLIAGYAGDEEWMRRGEPITLGTRRFAPTGGQRRIAVDLLLRAGEFRGIQLFSGRDDASDPNALYVPTAPGCVFQSYVREDLLRR